MSSPNWVVLLRTSTAPLHFICRLIGSGRVFCSTWGEGDACRCKIQSSSSKYFWRQRIVPCAGAGGTQGSKRQEQRTYPWSLGEAKYTRHNRGKAKIFQTSTKGAGREGTSQPSEWVTLALVAKGFLGQSFDEFKSLCYLLLSSVEGRRDQSNHKALPPSTAPSHLSDEGRGRFLRNLDYIPLSDASIDPLTTYHPRTRTAMLDSTEISPLNFLKTNYKYNKRAM
jgi:hypothetical protein